MIIVSDPQIALDAVPATGGTVFFPNGEYVTTGPLNVKPNTTIRGESKDGVIVRCADDGWLMTTADTFGIFQLTEAHNTTIESMTIKGTKSQPINRSPKLVMSVDARGVKVQNCRLTHSAFEGIWQGGTIALNRDHVYRGNKFDDVGWPAGAFTALPALQMNCVDSLAYDNVFDNVGTGIGGSGSSCSIFHNTILDAYLGISTGDAGEQIGMSVIDNFVRVTSRPSFTARGIMLGGSGGTQSTNLCARNRVEITSDSGDASATGIRCTTARDASIHDNDIIIRGSGIGIEMFGPTDPTEMYTRRLSENKVTAVNQWGYTQAILARPQHNGGILNVRSSNNKVLGVVKELDGWAYDFRSATNGQYDYMLFEDYCETGLVRVQPNYYPYGEFDDALITLVSAT